MSSKLFLCGNCADWTVVDAEDFCVGVGETPDEAIASARKHTNAPIETYWGIVKGDDF